MSKRDRRPGKKPAPQTIDKVMAGTWKEFHIFLDKAQHGIYESIDMSDLIREAAQTQQEWVDQIVQDGIEESLNPGLLIARPHKVGGKIVWRT